MSFQNLGLSEEVVHGVQSMGYLDPTPIQLQAFPIVLGGRDLIGASQTGTGKTAAFMLPILSQLKEHGALRVLVLEPTRELAAQVDVASRDYSRFSNLRTTVIYGGVGYGQQTAEVKRGTDILVATPGTAARPDGTGHRLARHDQASRPRRGRPDARHGFHARCAPHH